MKKKLLIGASALILLAGTAGLAVAKYRGHHGGPVGGKMSILKTADADKNGEISKEELQAAQEKKFKEFDKNSDGIITAQEVQDKLAERFERLAKRITRRFDKDLDGKVTAAEFKAHADHKLFMLDLNDDGKIGKDEMPRHFGRHNERHFGRRGGHDRGHHRGHKRDHGGRHSNHRCERHAASGKYNKDHRGSYQGQKSDKADQSKVAPESKN